jgi:hypothetical protein
VAEPLVLFLYALRPWHFSSSFFNIFNYDRPMTSLSEAVNWCGMQGFDHSSYVAKAALEGEGPSIVSSCFMLVDLQLKINLNFRNC